MVGRPGRGRAVHVAAMRLPPGAQGGHRYPAELSLAQKLKFVQERLEAGQSGAGQIWQSIGVYLGYAIAHYASFYELEHMLILGRVTSGAGGADDPGRRTIRCLRQDFPELAGRIDIQLPDELSRRLGQSIAAASLPEIWPVTRLKRKGIKVLEQR